MYWCTVSMLPNRYTLQTTFIIVQSSASANASLVAIYECQSGKANFISTSASCGSSGSQVRQAGYLYVSGSVANNTAPLYLCTTTTTSSTSTEFISGSSSCEGYGNQVSVLGYYVVSY
jgi:hypothetical protein